MATFEVILLYLLAGVALTLLAPRLGLPWPAVLALAGTGLAFIPAMPSVPLDPDLALALFFAPVLLDSAYDTSPRALRENWKPVSSLVLIAVVLTVAAVAVVARVMVPDMPWTAAVALGAIVAPPDAAAAGAILQQVRLPQRIVLVLEGESLLNDGSALLIYAAAVQAASGGVTLWTLPLLLLAVAGGIAVGYVLARAYLGTVSRVVRDDQMAASVLLGFMGTFGVWILAERIGLSPVLTVVAYGMTIARHARGRMGPRERRMTFAIWDVVVFGLNVMAFLLTGLQIRGILAELNTPWNYAALAGAVLATCILVRLAWVMAYTAVARWTIGVRAKREGGVVTQYTPQGSLVIGWAGMRGVLTLGTALALPAQFPERGLIVFTAFAVVLGTLGFQGLTLRPLIERLSLPRDTREDEAALARVEALRAAIESLGAERDSEAGQVLARQYEARLAEHGRPSDATGLLRLRGRMLEAERDRLEHLHEEGQIGDPIYRALQEELDWAEAALDSRRV
jgi:Na+/H+ antiporter